MNIGNILNKNKIWNEDERIEKIIIILEKYNNMVIDNEGKTCNCKKIEILIEQLIMVV
jgi:hypothetical protein